MNTKIIILLALLFLAVNSAVYTITEINEKQRIKLVLEDNIQTLKTHYEILLQTQKTTAVTLYQATIELDRVLQIMSEANSATDDEKALLREELHNILNSRYSRAKQKGVLQYQFILPNNESFLRMHKPEKFGDDLTDIRSDFRYTNATKKPVRGFTQGRTAHGFRNTFPLFNRSGEHVGAMEISFSSDSFQWYLNTISHIHTHFLVDKHIFDAKAWARDDLILKYSQSAESSSYMITLGGLHSKEECIDENRVKLAPVREEIDSKIVQGEMFSLYVKHFENFEHIDVLAFLPVKNLEKKTVAWLVSFEENEFIGLTLKSGLIIRIISFFASMVLIYFIIAQVRSKASIERRHKLLDDILNATDDIMFITDFKSVSFSNDRFKHLFNVTDTQEFNEKTQENILSLFINIDGYLHSGMLKRGESFSSLIKDTKEDERVVSILDRHFEAKAFQISISKTNFADEFLVTLSDITRLKEKHIKTENKAYFDNLTKVYNRNKFDEVLDNEMSMAKKYNSKFTMALMDIDKFKDFNDTYGHLIGDEVLIMMAQSVNSHVRASDTFARWGGEEFVILFKEASLEDAKVASLKIKDSIQELKHPVAGGITASFGLTEYIHDDTPESLFKRCDKALYLAKENGRNRVETL
ncbi:MAG: diguanylate cyclase [Campylobacterota bacterium]